MPPRKRRKKNPTTKKEAVVTTIKKLLFSKKFDLAAGLIWATDSKELILKPRSLLFAIINTKSLLCLEDLARKIGEDGFLHDETWNEYLPSPLYFAAQKSWGNGITYLIKHVISDDKIDNWLQSSAYNKSPLHFPSLLRNKNFNRLLLKITNKKLLRQQNLNGLTPLHIALQHKLTKTALLLIEQLDFEDFKHSVEIIDRTNTKKSKLNCLQMATLSPELNPCLEAMLFKKPPEESFDIESNATATVATKTVANYQPPTNNTALLVTKQLLGEHKPTLAAKPTPKQKFVRLLIDSTEYHPERKRKLGHSYSQ